ncbi:hypothetical protein [Pseudomonas sp. GM17]|uniref:hypothetical protein n=1 Tax=Pseudomonas sp. GM17 TaxID=1144323 RepID=UPI0002727208|nr:hypothetical protein [Pseudomonas sp. GM17]WIE52603.1 hypothetical protein PMI20_013670 [Pseudomonas sp. GM17]
MAKKIERHLLSIFTLTGLVLGLSGCETRSFTNLYPSTYEPPLSREQLYIPRSYSRDIFLSLPAQYKLAAYSKKLLCIKDREGQIKSFGIGESEIIRYIHGNRFIQRTQRLESSGYFVALKLPAHPETKCYVRKNAQLFDSAWFTSWERYLATWQSRELEIAKLNNTSDSLINDLGDSTATAALLDQENSRIDEEIKRQNAQIALLIKEQESLKARLGESKSYSLISAPISFSLYSAFVSSGTEFNPKLPYDKKNDPWLPEAEKHLVDISSKSWGGQLPRGSFLDPELAAKLDQMAAAWKNPQLAGPNLAGKIQSLKDAGMSNIVATSAVRTPWGQATVASGTNPKGSYVGSSHLTGQGLDIVVPFTYTSSNHAKLREVANSFGLALPVKNDAVHITMAKPTSSQNSRAIAIFSSYYKVAKNLKEKQQTLIDGKKEDISKLTEKAEKINKDIKEKRDSLRNKSSLFERNSAQTQSLLAENQLLTEAVADKEEKERQEQNSERGHDDDHGYSEDDRWGPDQDEYPDDDRSSGQDQNQDQNQDQDPGQSPQDDDRGYDDDSDRGGDGLDLGPMG